MRTVGLPGPLRALSAAVVLAAVSLGVSAVGPSAGAADHAAFYLDLGASVSMGE
jgi:hypothetical protein